MKIPVYIVHTRFTCYILTMKTVFLIITALIVAYTVLCFINIILSWIPGAKFTQFGKFVSTVTDPYLNLFRKISWLHTTHLDFSPILALGILSALCSILSAICRHDEGTILGPVLAYIIESCWGIASSITGFLILLLLIRFIVLCVQGGRTDYNSIWAQLDNFLGKIALAISRPFMRDQNNYKACLLISLICLLVVNISGTFLFTWLKNLCLVYIPF